VSPVKYELGFYIPEDGILHIHRRKNLKFYTSYRVLKLSREKHYFAINKICLIHFICRFETAYDLNCAPISSGVQSRREIISGGTRTKMDEYHWSKPWIILEMRSPRSM
jgi:hypothetical protein